MIESLEMKDFGCYERVFLKIGGAGLVLVTGENLDSEGADSNGSGKSHLFKGIGWTLFGESVDGERGDGVIRHGARKAENTIKFIDGHRFVRARKKGSPTLEGYNPRGERLVLDKKELQEYIDKLFGMDWLRFRNSVLFGQRDTKRFLSPGTSDADRKDLFHRILGTAVFKPAHEKAKIEALELKRKIEALESAISVLDGKIEALDLESLTDENQEWDEKRGEAVEALKERARALIEKAGALNADGLAALEARLLSEEDYKPKADAARKTWMQKEKEHSKAQGELRNLKSDLSGSKRIAKELKEALDAAGEGSCPVCNSDLSSGLAVEHLDTLRRKRKKALAHVERGKEHVASQEEFVEKAEAASLKAQGRLDAAVEEDDEHEEALSAMREEIEELRSSAASADLHRASARSLIEQARAKKKEVNPLKGRLVKARKDAKEWKRELKVKKIEMLTTRSAREHVLFWVQGYSAEGLPSWALDSVMPFMTERANYYLGTLSDGDLTVVFNTQSELKSTKGAIRDKISVDWTVEGIENAPPSGGQWRKLEIATDLAFMDLACEYGAKPDLLLMDECLDGLDGEGQSRVIELLKELRTRRSSVWVISHDEAVGEAFENVVKFVKEGGISGIEEAA